ncbi:MAG: hypothetical protein HZA84_07515 [Thaumarchaeota archaeon]|nr:hypothetical protein [Nitrososphaerota archaeon]
MNTLEVIVVAISISLLGTSFLLVEASGNFPLRYKNFYYNISYNVTDGITVNSLSSIEGQSSILLLLVTESDGSVSLDIPSALTQYRYKCVPSRDGDRPYILVNGRETEFTMSENSGKKTISLEIPITKETTELEIIFSADMGSWAFPMGCPIELFENAIPYQPKKQIQKGIEPINLVCKKGLELTFKSKNSSPACVKPETIPKLIERGWIEYEFPIVFETDRYEYKFGELIKITMKNIGHDTLKTSSTPVGFSIYDENDKRVCTWNGVNLQVGSFATKETLTETLDDGCRDLVNGGLYKIEADSYQIKADHFYEFGLWQNYHGPIHKIRILP